MKQSAKDGAAAMALVVAAAAKTAPRIALKPNDLALCIESSLCFGAEMMPCGFD
ncbi:hypothetical protein JVX96_27025 [Variovorax sp. PDNC026]|uniref:hypothetical protein n=1 Tax=Variovorax sp. PDNC026 TaxID=2811425 RepID=UPI001964665E|nr:hypothetical protein [Variovorax sp. PDNC026]QRY31662.1 hypothetical protein JVX96_27025 [Variovorax sp. PDNC026]